MIEILTSFIILISTFYGIPQTANAEAIGISHKAKFQIEDRNIVDGVALISRGGNVHTVEIDVREYFEDIPILAEIAKCESKFRHVGKKGEVIRGMIDKDDIGVMQINTYFHGETAQKMGLDLKTLSGNLAYAKALYEKEGTVPWKSSSNCWEKYDQISKI